MSTAPACAAADTTARIAGDDFTARVRVSAFNRRLQVLDYRGPDLQALVRELQREAAAHGFGKVFMKARDEHRDRLLAAGMVDEASIWGYYPDGEAASVVSLFVDPARLERPHEERQDEILETIRERPADPSLPELPGGYTMAVSTRDDAAELAALYAEVFASYPFPITDPAYLVDTMASHVVYRLVRDADGSLVAAASAETDAAHGNAEMTDFATLPSQRGVGLAQHILAALEDDMVERGIGDLYTIARARSAGMNRVFYNRGYRLTGTLVNNCHIAGGFEDMHVWCRRLEA